jgi:hypothetical protein
MGATYEMLWDCAFCGTQKNLGKTHRHCPGCGAPQDPKARYFPEEADKVAVEDHVFVGRDRQCAGCQAPMSAKASHCGTCGAPLESAAEVALVTDPRVAPPASPAEGQAGVIAAASAANGEAKGSAKKKSTKGRDALVLGGFVSALAGGAAYLGWTEDIPMQVVSRTWERTIEVEAFGKVERAAFCDELPSGAHVLSRARKVRGTREVADGETCSTTRIDNGDGTFHEEESCRPRTKSEDVYADHCKYEINEWSTRRVARATGGGEQPRSWPEVGALREGTCVGCERRGKEREILEVRLKATAPDEDGKRAGGTCTVSAARFEQLRPGTRWSVPVSLGGGLDCDALVPEGAAAAP